jgi:hypothetical protein
MAKILLLDFSETDFRYLSDKKFDVELRETNWKSGKIESLVPPQDCTVVFYQADLTTFGTGLHAGEAENFEKIVADGGAVISFVGSCQEYHLTNIIGAIPQLKLEENNLPDKLFVTKEGPFSPIFEQFGPFVSRASELFQTHDTLGKTLNLKDWDPPFEGELQTLAESYRNYPVSAVVRKGKGFYLFLPWFGEKNVQVAELLLNDILPGLTSEPAAGEERSWVDSYEYVFPSLLEVYKQMEEENEQHRQRLLRLEEKIGELKSNEQEPFTRLLTGQGPELREAVVRALKYLNWLSVVDVDEYWKRVIRIKEEDLWLLDEDDRTVEDLIRSSHLTLVTVRSGAGGAEEEECLLLQRYKGRRMQEFNNTRMKAVLIGNYFWETEPKLRQVPFTEAQISEAAKDGNALLPTYELFKAIKAEKEKKISKEEIREQMKTKVGLITFES